MYEGLRSPAIHRPISQSELFAVAAQYPQATYWAGGTYIMSRKDFYPSSNSNDIIYLGDVPELKRITRNDRSVEIGSMVTIDQLNTSGKLILSDLLLDVLSTMSTSVIRKQATIGGSLCTPNVRYSLSCALSILDAQVEVKQFQSRRTDSSWVPVSRLYEKDGTLGLTPGSLITRLRIGLGGMHDFEKFAVVGQPFHKPESAIVFACMCTLNQASIQKAKFCYNYPTAGLHMSKELEGLLSGLPLPVAPDTIFKLANQLAAEISSQHLSVTPLQIEQSRRLLVSVFQDLNTRAMEA